LSAQIYFTSRYGLYCPFFETAYDTFIFLTTLYFVNIIQREIELGYQERSGKPVDILSSIDGEESRRHGIKLLLEHQNWPLHPEDMLVLDIERREFFACPENKSSITGKGPPIPVTPLWFISEGKPALHGNFGDINRMHLASLAAATLAEAESSSHSPSQLSFEKEKWMPATKPAALEKSSAVPPKTVTPVDLAPPKPKKAPETGQSSQQQNSGTSTGALVGTGGKSCFATPNIAAAASSENKGKKLPGHASSSSNTMKQSNGVQNLQLKPAPVENTLEKTTETKKQFRRRTESETIATGAVAVAKTSGPWKPGEKSKHLQGDLKQNPRPSLGSAKAAAASSEANSPPPPKLRNDGMSDDSQDSIHRAGTPKTGNVLASGPGSRVTKLVEKPRDSALDLPDLRDDTQPVGVLIINDRLQMIEPKASHTGAEISGHSTDSDHLSPGQKRRRSEQESHESNKRPVVSRPSPVQTRNSSITSSRIGSLIGNDMLSLQSSTSHASRSATNRMQPPALKPSFQRAPTDIPLPNMIKAVDRQQSIESLGSFNSIHSVQRSLTPSHRPHDSPSTPNTAGKDFEELDKYLDDNKDLLESPAHSRHSKLGETNMEQHEMLETGEMLQFKSPRAGTGDEPPTLPPWDNLSAPKNKIEFMKQNKARKQMTPLREGQGVHIHDQEELRQENDRSEPRVSAKGRLPNSTSFEEDSTSVHTSRVLNGVKHGHSPHFQEGQARANGMPNSLGNDLGRQLRRNDGTGGEKDIPVHQQGPPLHNEAMAQWLSGSVHSFGGQPSPPAELYPRQMMPFQSQPLSPNPLNSMYGSRVQQRAYQDQLAFQSRGHSPQAYGYGVGDRGGLDAPYLQRGYDDGRGIQHDPHGALQRQNTPSPMRPRTFGHLRAGSVREGTAIYLRQTLTVCCAHTSDIYPVGGNAEDGCDSLLIQTPANSREDLDIIKHKCSVKNGGRALFTSWKKRLPIRVFRFTSKSGIKGYRYDGLFSVMAISDDCDKILTDIGPSTSRTQVLLRRNEAGSLDRDMNAMSLDELWSLINQGEVQEGGARSRQLLVPQQPRAQDLAIPRLSHDDNGMSQYSSTHPQHRAASPPRRALPPQYRQQVPMDPYIRQQMEMQQRAHMPPGYYDPRVPPSMAGMHMMDGAGGMGRPQKNGQRLAGSDPRMY
jgi:hypothetical protein